MLIDNKIKDYLVWQLTACTSYDIEYRQQHQNYNTFETVMTINKIDYEKQQANHQ